MKTVAPVARVNCRRGGQPGHVPSAAVLLRPGTQGYEPEATLQLAGDTAVWS